MRLGAKIWSVMKDGVSVDAKPLTLLSAAAGLTLLLSACGGDSLTLPSDGEAARIEVWGGWAGGTQQGRVGAQLSEPLAVRVTDTQDRPVIGVTVQFAIEDGSGSTATPVSIETGDSGIARTVVTLGTRVGAVTGQARVVVDEGQAPVQTDFVATALSENANEIALWAGDGQSGAVGTVLGAPLVVRVTDAFGNPVPGITVNWTADGGGGVSAASTQTDVNGQASVQRTLGPTAGPQTTSATADLAGSPVVFNHTATAGSAARVIVVDGDGQQAAPGATLPEPLVVQVLDADNNPIVNRAVTWVIGIGGGSVNPTTSNTDEQGRATTQWTLGPEPGRNTVSAVVSGVGIGAFNATATVPKTSSSTSIVSHQPEPSTVGQPVEVQVQVSGSDGTPTGTVSVTGDNASAPCTITLSNGAGACSLTFNAVGQQRITATYAGDSRFNGSDDNENHRVEQVPPQNNPPTASFTPPSCVAGQPCSFQDSSTDSDGNIVGWSWDFGVAGTSDQQNPSATFTEAGSYSVTLIVTDDDGATAQVTHTVNVSAPANTPPSAVDDNYATSAGEPLFVDAGAGVLANDSDAESNPLTVQSNTQPSQGIVTVNEEGGFQYFPGGASGTQDSFTYTVSDGNLTSSATVTITIQ